MKYEFLLEHGNKAATLLNLSESGAVKLIPFEDKAHFEALKIYSSNKLVRQNRVERPLNFYLKLCHSVSDDKGLRVNYGPYNDYIAVHSIQETDNSYLPLKQTTQTTQKPQTKQVAISEPRHLDPIYEGYIMAGLRASGLFDSTPEFVLSFSDAIFSLAEQNYIRAFLCGDIYQPDIATITLGVFSMIDKQYALKTEEKVDFGVSLEEMKNRSSKGIFDYNAKLYKKAQS